jgi:hypothetical protein
MHAWIEARRLLKSLDEVQPLLRPVLRPQSRVNGANSSQVRPDAADAPRKTWAVVLAVLKYSKRVRLILLGAVGPAGGRRSSPSPVFGPDRLRTVWGVVISRLTRSAGPGVSCSVVTLRCASALIRALMSRVTARPQGYRVVV